MAEHKSKSKTITRRQALAISLAAAGAGTVGAAQASPKPRRRRPLEGKRVLIGISDFSESLETYYMIYRLMEEGAVPVVTAPAVKRLELVVHYDEPGYLSYCEKPGYPIDVQTASNDVEPADHDGLLLPGGRAPEELRLDEGMIKIVGHFLDKKKPLGAMCHGVMLLYTGRPIKGRRVTANRQIRPDIEQLGGKFLDQPVVVDGALVTSRGYGDLPYFMPKFLEVLAR